MPQKKRVEVKSLFECCAEYVADNMGHWCKKSGELIQTTDPEMSNNPFDALPTIALEPIVTLLSQKIHSGDRRKGDEQHFGMLMTPQLKSLDMSMLSEMPEMSSCINLASLRCHLKCLKLTLPHHYEEVLVHLCALKFENLQILDISFTTAGDHCLQIIGTHCQKLKELNVGYCENVTDAGIKGLCASVDNLGEKDERMGLCKTMKKLCFCGTKITKAGAQLALQNLRSLKSLKGSDHVVQLLAKMHQQDFLNNKLHDVSKYSLIDMELDFLFNSLETYTSGSLGLAASLCPLVTEVMIKLSEEENFTDEDLLGLLHLKNLHLLSVNANSKITFDGGLSPLLRAFGRSLGNLEIGFFTDVNIGTIIKDCPNLRELKLEDNANYSMTFPHEGTKSLHSKRMKLELPVFNHLENLHYFGNDDDTGTSVINIPSEILVCLFSSPILRKVDIYMCPSLTDDVFKKAFKLHQFKYLEQLTLSFCDSITKRGIDVLMNDCNPLIFIDVSSCNLLTKKNVQDWKKKQVKKTGILDLAWNRTRSE